MRVRPTARGLLAVCLLVVGTTRAHAQFGDPLTLATVGALVPFVSNAANGDVAFLEVVSPVTDVPGFQMVLFTASCIRTVSLSLPLSTNDVAVVQLGSFLPPGFAGGGLVALASAAANLFDLVPLVSSTGAPAPIQARIYWLNSLTGRFRVLEPIALGTADGVGFSSWVPLRTGATFFAPLETSSVQTTLYMICPRATIQSATPEAGVFAQVRFPPVATETTFGFQAVYPVGALRGRVYDVNELFLADVVTDCDCFQQKPLSALHPIYSNAVLAPDGTYTELESSAGPPDFAFTGYKSISAAGVPPIDLFGRLSGAARARLTGDMSGIPR